MTVFKELLSLFSLMILMSIVMTGCKSDNKKPFQVGDTSLNSNSTKDPHTYADPQESVINHLDLHLKVDFSSKTLSGTAKYSLKNAENATKIILDARNLDIRNVKVDGQEATFTLGQETPFLGQSLTIPIQPTSNVVEITYSTKPDAEALQWLVAEQTAGKQHPYLFTQGQAILTRTWIPIQDSPGIRLTYSATIEVPKELMAVMSASNPQSKNDTGVYTFEMKQPIPAYLIALSVGDLSFKYLGPRTGVYTEPSRLEKVAAEFSDLEKMVTAAEDLYGPYQWDRYDVIVLPPSFPFGGMENPRLTFATPTIIAGDKSLIALIAHELAHSWSGNLVTNATWNDFWLNEGFTVYFEHRIMEAMYGKSYTEMLTELGHQGLKETVASLPEDDTHLYLKLEGRNPDDGMTDIAYEKGAHFLLMLEQLAGREKFDAFLRKYFDDHKFQSMTTDAFITYLKTNLLEPNQINVNLDEWIYGPGLPENCPVTVSERFREIDADVQSYLKAGDPSSFDPKEWSTHEWLHFIRALPKTINPDWLRNLDTKYALKSSGNSEIQAAWYELGILAGYGKDILPEVRAFLVEVGRRKFLTPIYTALIQSGMKAEAQSIFDEAKANYHSVSSNTIQGLLTKSNG